MDSVTAALYQTAVQERYHVLRLALVIARKRPDWGLRLDQAEAIRQEKRALVRVRWFVRRESRRQAAARRAVLSLPYHDWQSLPEAIYEAVR